MSLAARSVNSGTGIDVLVDDCATGDIQLQRIAAGVVGSEEIVGSLDHGSNHSLYVHPRPDTVYISTPTNSSGLTTASTAYTAGDVMGAGWTVANAAKASGGTGRIVAVSMMDYSDIVTGVTLFFFQGSVTFGTDNAAPSISDADSLKYVGQVPLAFTDLGSVRVGAVDSMSLAYVLDGTDLFVYCTTTVGHTFFGAATDLKLRVAVTRD